MSDQNLKQQITETANFKLKLIIFYNEKNTADKQYISCREKRLTFLKANNKIDYCYEKD